MRILTVCRHPLLAAVEACDMNCLNTMCTMDDSGMPCVDPYQCVEQADGNWAQCVGNFLINQLK